MVYSVYSAKTNSDGIFPNPATVEDAKDAIDKYIRKNMGAYQNGYKAYIIDAETDTVVATATKPTEPVARWVDLKY